MIRKGFIKSLHNELNDFAQYLMNYNYDSNKAMTVISNEEKQTMVEAGINRFEEFAMRLKSGDHEWFDENQSISPKIPILPGSLIKKVEKNIALKLFNSIYPAQTIDAVTLSKKMKLYGIEPKRQHTPNGEREQYYTWA